MSLAAGQKAKSSPDEMALADENGEITWAALDTILNRATNALLALNLTPGARIGVFANNSAETVLAYLAGLHAGISSIPINFHLTAEEVAYILGDAQAELLFVGPETAKVGLAAAALSQAEGGALPKVVGWRTQEEGVVPWLDFVASGSDAEPPTGQPPLPYLHYTSGTTGRPKGAVTPPNMFPTADTVAGFFALLREQVALAPPGPGLAVGPLYHTGPLGSTRQLGGGKPLVTLRRFDPETVLATIERYKVSSVLMVPTHFQRLLALPAEVRARYDVSSLRSVPHTGAACPGDVKRAMIDWFGPVLLEAYGGTESGTTNMISSAEWLAKPGSVGKTLPPFELLVIGEDGQELPQGGIGQLYFHDTTGRGIFYHNDPEKTAAAHLRPGVFTLGEVGYVDEDGYVFITDRVSDMIVSGGVNIYPAEAEQVLIRHPGVADVAVIGVPHDTMGEEVKALIMARDPAQPPSPEELDAFARRHLAGFKTPRSYDVVADLGRNAMGKVNKRQLRRPYWPTERTIGG
jgi:acyl-CoA synthetase (AMP-forming)/AMP-acid ligase II